MNQTNLVEPLCHLFGPREKFIRNLCLLLDPLTGQRVGDSKAPSMEHQSAGGDRLPVRFAVDGIAEKRMSQKAVVDAYLMGPTSVQSTKNQRGSIVSSVKQVEVGDCLFSRSRVADIHSLAVHGVTSDVVGNSLMGFFGKRLGDSEVKFGCCSVGKLSDQIF